MTTNPISEKTHIPLSFLFSVLTVAGSGIVFVIAGAMYASKIEAKAEMAIREIDSVKTESILLNAEINRSLREMSKEVKEMNTKVSRIEGFLERKQR